MTKLLTEVTRKTVELPADRQDDAAHVLLHDVAVTAAARPRGTKRGDAGIERSERVNFRGKDEKNCEVCGELLESWDGRRTPTFKLVKRGELPKR
jgi:hypothetical protein